MARILEAHGWQNVWDIYWVKMQDGRPVSLALTTEDAFDLVSRETHGRAGDDGREPSPVERRRN
ncbi:MAG: hypothetical protein ACR652_24785 [Methylocystis sp.]|uniref:hypothetical protein n=1 Tax=Methylocystis sp. TaxID=1911079 RepID=UPI003DA6BAA2